MESEEQTEPRQQAFDDIEQQARDLVRVINSEPEDEREILREIAVSVLRDEVQIVSSSAAAATPAIGRFNFFGIGIPLFLIGAVFIFLFPPIGLLFFAVAGLTVACGVGVILFSRRTTT